MTLRIVIAGGGTAGHVYPGLALADALRGADPDVFVSFVGTSRGIETTAVPAAGYALDLVEVVAWSKTLGAKRFTAPVSVLNAARAARAMLQRREAGVVVGMGGYASLPAVLAARTRRIPTVLHEQNAVPGLANLAGARVTRNIALGFEEARSAFPRSALVRVVGNPIRSAIASLDVAASRHEARSALGLKPDVTTLVVFGGSLGAARLDEVAVSIAGRWRDRDDRQLLVIAGPKHVEAIRRAIPAGGSCAVLGFLDRMEHAYAAADLVVARAGAATVAEISAVGLPAVLVPYPFARRDHQTANARSLAADGGAIVVPDTDATPERMIAMIDELLADQRRLRSIAAAAKAYGKPDAAARLARWVLELAGRPT